MRKFLDSLFKNESDDPPEVVASNSPQNPRKVYGDSPTPDSEIVLKIVVIGGANSGKTSVVRRYLQGCFTHQYIPTIGIDLSTAKLQPRNNPTAEYRIQFWDVSHVEVRGKHHKSIFKGAVGIVMVFDCCNVKSVTAVDEWRLAYEESAKLIASTSRRGGGGYNNANIGSSSDKIPMILLANKSDVGPPVIKPADLDTYCERGGYSIWRMTSSRSGNSVIEAMDKLFDLAIEFRELQQVNRRRKPPEKLISTKSQLLSPPMRATGTSSTAGTPANNSASSQPNSAHGPQYSGTSLSSSSGGENNGNNNINNNNNINSGSYMSSSFTPTTTYTMRNYSNNSSYSSSRNFSNVTTPNVVSPTVSSPSLSSKTTTLVHAEIPVYSGNPLSPSLSSQPTSPHAISSRTAPSLSLDDTTSNNENEDNNNNAINKSKNDDDDDDDNKGEAIHSETIMSIDASMMGINESKSSPPCSPSSSPSSSATTSASASSHASQRNFISSGEKDGIRNSSSMDFAYLHGEVRPSIFSITNALAVEEIKLGELMIIAEEFYDKLKADLDQLFMSVKPSRKSDLQILEFQRFDEYIKLVEAIRVHKEKAETEGTENLNIKKLAPENLQILLSENMKKWNQLVMTLHTEVSLYKSGVFDPSSDSLSRPPIPVLGSSLKSSASDSMLYGRYESGPTTGSTSHTGTGASSPNRSRDHSALLTPPINNDHGDAAKRPQPGSARRMGFGFKNVGKNPSAILQLVSPNPTTSFSLDADNISSPPSPYNSVHSPTPSSPSTSPQSSPPFYSSSSTPSSSSSIHESHFRAHMEANGYSHNNNNNTNNNNKSQKSNTRGFQSHTRSISLSMPPPSSTSSSVSSSINEISSSSPPSSSSSSPPFSPSSTSPIPVSDTTH